MKAKYFVLYTTSSLNEWSYKECENKEECEAFLKDLPPENAFKVISGFMLLEEL